MLLKHIFIHLLDFLSFTICTTRLLLVLVINECIVCLRWVVVIVCVCTRLFFDDASIEFQAVDELLVDDFQLVVFGDVVFVLVLQLQELGVAFGVEVVESFT